MTDIFLGLASLAPVILVGCFLFLAVDHHRILLPAERLALGFGVGTGLLTWEMLVFHTFGFSFAVIGLLAPLLASRRPLFCLLDDTGRKGRSESSLAFASVPFERVEWLLIAAIVIETLAVFFHAWLLPIEAYDAVSNWGLKAKAIFLAGCIPENFLRNPNYEVFHPDYPLLVPLLESYIYRCIGDLREVSAKMVFPLYLVGCSHPDGCPTQSRAVATELSPFWVSTGFHSLLF